MKINIALFILIVSLVLSSCSLKENTDKIPEQTFPNASDVPPSENTTKNALIDFTRPFDESGLSTEKHEFSYGVAKDGQPHSISIDNQHT